MYVYWGVKTRINDVKFYFPHYYFSHWKTALLNDGTRSCLYPVHQSSDHSPQDPFVIWLSTDDAGLLKYTQKGFSCLQRGADRALWRDESCYFLKNDHEKLLDMSHSDNNGCSEKTTTNVCGVWNLTLEINWFQTILYNPSPRSIPPFLCISN